MGEGLRCKCRDRPGVRGVCGVWSEYCMVLYCFWSARGNIRTSFDHNLSNKYTTSTPKDIRSVHPGIIFPSLVTPPAKPPFEFKTWRALRFKSAEPCQNTLRQPRTPNIILKPNQPELVRGAVGFVFFSFLAQRRPQALQRVFGPVGPFRHSGESRVPELRIRMCQDFR